MEFWFLKLHSLGPTRHWVYKDLMIKDILGTGEGKRSSFPLFHLSLALGEWMDGWMYVCLYAYIYVSLSLSFSVCLSLHSHTLSMKVYGDCVGHAHNELTPDKIIQVDVCHWLSCADIGTEPDLIEHVFNLSGNGWMNGEKANSQ